MSDDFATDRVNRLEAALRGINDVHPSYHELGECAFCTSRDDITTEIKSLTPPPAADPPEPDTYVKLSADSRKILKNFLVNLKPDHLQTANHHACWFRYEGTWHAYVDDRGIFVQIGDTVRIHAKGGRASVLCRVTTVRRAVNLDVRYPYSNGLILGVEKITTDSSVRLNRLEKALAEVCTVLLKDS